MRALKFDETEMAYLSVEQISPLLADLDSNSKAAGLKPNQVRDKRIHFTRTKSSKNRAVPISDSFAKLLKGKLPFPASYKKFEKSVDAIGLELPAGQLTHVLRHTFASHYMMNGGDILTLQRVLGHASLTMTMKYAHFSPGHLAEVVTLNPLSFDNAAKEKMNGR